MAQGFGRAKRPTEVVLVNPLKVVLLSPPDKETSLGRLSNFSKALQLEVTEPAMGLSPPKPALLLLTLVRAPVAGRGRGKASASRGSKVLI